MKIHKWSPVRILAVGFAGIIFMGSVLLALPIASRSGESIPFLHAIFTSASATCVTGLVVYDTWSQFSAFGQVVLLLLIQLGGLGFMTAAMSISLAARRRIGLRQRSILAEAAGTTRLAGVVRLTRQVLIGTALFELGGAALLSLRMIPRFGVIKGLWYALFHAVSAFCNAGFDLMGYLSPGSSLTLFYDDPVVVVTIAVLIAVGGIGFVVWNDLLESGASHARLKLHTRVALSATAILIAVSAVLFFCMERHSAMAGMTVPERVLTSFFQAVTPRTAGFNTLDTARLSDGGKVLTMLLMFIGAAPGGTGGGIKVTTFVVACAAVFAALRGREDVSVGHFRLEPKTVNRAFCGMTVYMAIALLGVMILCVEGVPFTDAVFECLSAIGTVGLSTGVTASLSAVSKVVIILLMYAGRVGSLSVFLAVTSASSAAKLKDPVGKVIVG